MTYSVKWVPTDVSFARRFEVYLDYPFFEHQVNGNECFMEKELVFYGNNPSIQQYELTIGMF